jgi:hypothetical protein
MTVDRALKILGDLLPATHVEARQKTDHYGSAWVVYALVGDDYERPLTQSATGDPYTAARWINEFDRKKAEILGVG